MSQLRADAPIFRLGDSGEAVAEIRQRLIRLQLLGPATEAGRHRADVEPGDADRAVYDEQVDRAVRAFQQQRGLTVDGVVGPATYRVLDESRWRLGDRLLTHIPGNLVSGDDVVTLQQRLLDLGFKVGRVDGIFGHQTEQGVRDFQRNIAIPPDGTCGPSTLKALARLAPRVRGGQPNALRAEEHVRRAGPQLTGKVVVIDAAPGPADEITLDLARRVEGRLMATGVSALLTHTGSGGGDGSRSRDGGDRSRHEVCDQCGDTPVTLRRPADERP